ncbi:DUF3862 domain-containing protein [Companilactobacillus sp. HBUAS59544]|uniref:DUF3862 domain-containing protein n=1 Tax=Companilactobacillus sp. HBUAS59544 TaxID=3109363 RepID=UPI002FF19491
MTENEKKPFYKRNWFWITIISIIVVVSATTYVANYSFYSDKADQISSEQRKNLKSQEKAEKSPSLITKYNSIKTGNKGYSKKVIYKLLGNPVETQVQSNEISNVTWKGRADESTVTIQITFENGHAVSKSIQGLDIDREKTLTLADYQKLNIGDSYNRVVNLLGDPDDYSDINGVRTLTYVSDLSELDPTQNASIQIKLSHNQIVAKSQTNLK